MKKKNKIGVRFELSELKKGTTLYARVTYKTVNTKFSLGESFAKGTTKAEIEKNLAVWENIIRKTIRFLESRNVNVKMAGFSDVVFYASEDWKTKFMNIIVASILNELGDYISYNSLVDIFRQFYVSQLTIDEHRSNLDLILFIETLKLVEPKSLKKLSKDKRIEIVEYVIAQFLDDEMSIIEFITNENSEERINLFSKQIPFDKFPKVSIPKNYNFGQVIKKKLINDLMLNSPASKYKYHVQGTRHQKRAKN